MLIFFVHTVFLRKVSCNSFIGFRSFFLFLVFSFLFFPQPVIHASGYQVNIEANPEYQERYYSICDGLCEFKWEIYLTEINKGIIGNRTACYKSLQDQAYILSELLQTVLDDKKGSGPYHTLFWRRLYNTDSNSNNNMAVRLAVAASRSLKWDKKKGRFQEGYSIVDLANDAMIYQELFDVFRGAGLKLKMVSGEKVLIARADKVSFFSKLKEHGIKPEDRIPYDFMVWFSIYENQ